MLTCCGVDPIKIEMNNDSSSTGEYNNGVSSVTSIMNDPFNCGNRGNRCPVPLNTIAVCQNGKCGTVCQPHFADCNHDLILDGCEVDLSSDLNNCNKCRVACDLPNAEMVCLEGQCKFLKCLEGYGDCAVDTIDPTYLGCESNLLKGTYGPFDDHGFCGACEMKCPDFTHCNDGQCIND